MRTIIRSRVISNVRRNLKIVSLFSLITINKVILQEFIVSTEIQVRKKLESIKLVDEI